MRSPAAAPTAGLHFTPEVLAGLDVERVTLHVGLDTFRPLGVDDLADHVLARFEKAEADEVARMTTRAAEAAEMFITSGIGAVMNGFNGGDPATTE